MSCRGGSSRGEVGHVGVGWGWSCRGGVGNVGVQWGQWVMQGWGG